MDIFIIGASFAGLAAAQAVLQTHPQARISILERQKAPLHYPNAFNRLLRKEIASLDDSRVPVAAVVNHPRIRFYPGHDLLAIDWKRQSLTAKTSQGVQEFSYDKLILAIGADQSRDLLDEGAEEWVLTFKSWQESQESLARVKQARSVAVVGAGQLGMEGLDALNQLDLALTLIEAQAYPLAKQLDKDMAELVSAKLAKTSIQSLFGTAVERIVPNPQADGLVIETVTGRLAVDLVLLATNFSPNSSRLPADLALNSDGSVVVDAYLRTNLPHIFAVGDLIQLPVPYFGTAYLPMISHALLTGRLVAENLLTSRLALPISSRQLTSQVFDLTVLSLGATERELSLFEPFFSLSRGLKQSQTTIKCHFSQSEASLLGAQLLSSQECRRLNQALIEGLKTSRTAETLLMQVLAWDDLTQEEQLLLDLLREAVTIWEEGTHED